MKENGGSEIMNYMDTLETQTEARRIFAVLQERFKQNFDHLSEEELRMFKTKVSDLLDLLRTKERRDY